MIHSPVVIMYLCRVEVTYLSEEKKTPAIFEILVLLSS